MSTKRLLLPHHCLRCGDEMPREDHSATCETCHAEFLLVHPGHEDAVLTCEVVWIGVALVVLVALAIAVWS